MSESFVALTTNVGQVEIEYRLRRFLEGRTSAASFLCCSFLYVISTVVLWSFLVQKVSHKPFWC